MTVLDFDQAYRTHYPRLMNHAAHHIPDDPHSAQDAVSEALARAWEGRNSYTDRGAGPLPWLVTLVKYAAWAVRRERDLLIDPALIPDREATPNNSPYPGLDDPVTQAALREVWPRLSYKQQACVWLVCIGGYSVGEAAHILGTTKTVVSSSEQEGLRSIRDWFRYGHASRDCPRCGYPRRSVGHQSVCPQPLCKVCGNPLRSAEHLMCGVKAPPGVLSATQGRETATPVHADAAIGTGALRGAAEW